MKHVRIQLQRGGEDNYIITDYAGRSLGNDKYEHKEVNRDELLRLWDDPYILANYELGSASFDSAMLFALNLIDQSDEDIDWRLVKGQNNS